MRLLVCGGRDCRDAKRVAAVLDEGKPDHCVAFPGGRGTNDMIVRCRRHNIPVTVVDE